MVKPLAGIGKGVINDHFVKERFKVARFTPSEALAPFVKHFWDVRWSIPHRELHEQHTIPHPSVHVVFEFKRSEVVGPITGRFTRELVNEGRVIGAHIQPGAFRVFSNCSVSSLVDQRPPTWSVMQWSKQTCSDLEAKLLSLDPKEAADAYEQALLPLIQKDHIQGALDARACVERIEEDAELCKVGDLAKVMGMTLRSLQRLFNEHVGHSPKFVIRRFRLLSAFERMDDFDATMASLAADLGYADQAHLSREFKKLVGQSPAAYRRSLPKNAK